MQHQSSGGIVFGQSQGDVVSAESEGIAQRKLDIDDFAAFLQ